MKKIICVPWLIILLTCAAFAQKLPTFSRFAAKVETVKAKEVDLKSHKNARMYRTNLRNAFKEGVNFAGHYILTNWGCGTNCSEGAVIDARTGKVFFPDEIEGASFGFCDFPDDTEPNVFKPNSRLFILNGFQGGDIDNKNSSCGVYYYEWTGTRFRLLKFTEKKRTDTP